MRFAARLGSALAGPSAANEENVEKLMQLYQVGLVPRALRRGRVR
jgi:hypothetical protein